MLHYLFNDGLRGIHFDAFCVMHRAVSDNVSMVTSETMERDEQSMKTTAKTATEGMLAVSCSNKQNKNVNK